MADQNFTFPIGSRINISCWTNHYCYLNKWCMVQSAAAPQLGYHDGRRDAASRSQVQVRAVHRERSLSRLHHREAVAAAHLWLGAYLHRLPFCVGRCYPPEPSSAHLTFLGLPFNYVHSLSCCLPAYQLNQSSLAFPLLTISICALSLSPSSSAYC